jgi:ATP-dependent RNA helicase DDX31/DBP7
MEEDGLVLNIDTAGSAPVAPPSAGQYKGKWKERALNRKWDRIKAKRALNNRLPAQGKLFSPSTERMQEMAPQQQDKTTKTTEDTERSSGPSRPLKRKRVASSSNTAPLGNRTFGSSSLFTGNPEIATTPTAKQELLPSLPEASHNSPTLRGAPDTSTPTLTLANDFTQLGISQLSSSHLAKALDITTPTEIQQLAIPRLLASSRDTFLRAQTGSGKTLAFILPIIHTLLSLPAEKRYDRTSGLFAIILTPTRELAKQTETVLTTLTAGTWIVPGWLLGGERKKSEKARLRKGVNILVATPGRLADHLDTTMAFDTSLVRWMVLDEGDRLVDMGFLETVGRILRIVEGRVQQHILKTKKDGIASELPPRLVKILCSATLRGEEGLGVLETIVNPIFLRAEAPSIDVDQVLAPGQLIQKAVVLPAKLRLVTLCAVLKSFIAGPSAKLIVFLSCMNSVDYHFQLLSSFNLESPFFQLHGSLEQPVRTATLKAFTTIKDRAVLLATDVASRGLDLPFVDIIVQFDPPVSQDDYIHRVGRTARAGRKGEGLIFLLPNEEEYIPTLESNGAVIQRVSYESILQKGFGKDWMNEATRYQLEAEKWILHDQEVAPSLTTLAAD